MSGLGGIFAFLLAGVITVSFLRWGGARDRRFLAGLFLAGFLVRAALSLALDVASWKATGSGPRITGKVEGWFLGVQDRTRGFLRLGDSDYHSERAWAYAEYARGNREPVVLYRIQETGWNLYPLLMGAFYYLFGFSPFSVKLLNAIAGALLGPVIFGIASRWGLASAGRLAALGVTLWPSLVLWSLSNLKDPLFLLCTALLFYAVSVVETTPSWRRRLVWGAGGMLLFRLHLDFGRPEFSWVLAVLLVAALFVRWARRRPWAWAIPIGALFLTAPLLRPRVEALLIAACSRHLHSVQSTGIVYHYLPDRFYAHLGVTNGSSAATAEAGDILRALPSALFRFLMEPLPWRTSDLMTLMVLPQMVLWYEMLPFAFWGIVRAQAPPIGHLWLTATLSVWSVMMALSLGGIGTLLRARDMVIPFFLLYAAIGMQRVFRPLWSS